METYHTIGNTLTFLQDIKARGFLPRGIIDVGANQGDWTKMATSVWDSANIIMVEPLNETRQALQTMCSDNPLLSHVHAGAGSTAGELVQTIWKDLVGSSFLPETNTAKLASGEQRITPIVTLDHILSENPRFSPDLVKLDVQGYELQVLEGASSLFGKTEVFILETSLFEFLPSCPTTIDCFNFMNSKGYAFYDITGFLRRPYDGALAQVDIAFARNDGPLRKSARWS